MKEPTIHFEPAGPYRYKIRRTTREDMRTDGLIFLSEPLLAKLQADQSPLQVVNVATLPGILGNSLAMPDIHWGYGFPIGGVAAFDADDGVISPGGVGYDINCGVSLARTAFTLDQIRPRIRALIDCLFQRIPTGVGSHGAIKISKNDFESILTDGANWAVKHGLTRNEDRLHMEDEGCLDGADPSEVSQRARERGFDQI
ncbi:MAG: RtcB family protein, partial [Calditrichota bacterium]